MASSSSLAPRAYQIERLNNANYATWSIKIEMLLTRSELWGVVDGSEPKPGTTNADALAAWQLKDSKARSDIMLHCGERQLLWLKTLKTSTEVLAENQKYLRALKLGLASNVIKKIG